MNTNSDDRSRPKSPSSEEKRSHKSSTRTEEKDQDRRSGHRSSDGDHRHSREHKSRRDGRERQDSRSKHTRDRSKSRERDHRRSEHHRSRSRDRDHKRSREDKSKSNERDHMDKRARHHRSRSRSRDKTHSRAHSHRHKSPDQRSGKVHADTRTMEHTSISKDSRSRSADKSVAKTEEPEVSMKRSSLNEGSTKCDEASAEHIEDTIEKPVKEAVKTPGDGDASPAAKPAAKKGVKKKTATKAKAGGAVGLSFEDELEEADASSSFSMGDSTKRHFRTAAPLTLRGDLDAPWPAPPAGGPTFNLSRLNGSLSAPECSSSLAALRIGAAQSRGMRPYMEDRHSIVMSYLPGAAARDGLMRSYCAVFDGHNGFRAAEMASTRMHALLAQDPSFAAAGDSAADEAVVEAAVTRVFHAMDAEILEAERAEGSQEGSTALVLMRLGAALYSAHAGDSRSVLSRAGVAERVTEDHKPNDPAEKARVVALGGSVEFTGCWRVVCDTGRGGVRTALAVSRGLGDPDFKAPKPLVVATPAVRRIALTPAITFVVMASDGLWDVLSDQQAVDIVSKELEKHTIIRGPASALNNGPEKAAAEKLIECALAAGTMDNITALVLLFPWE